MIKTFWLVLGYGCNNRCQGCYAEGTTFSGPWMEPSYAQDVMVTMKKTGAKSCLLIGGEPTLCEHLPVLVTMGNDIGLDMVVVTNGRILNDESVVADLFARGLARAVISLEGASADVHDSITRKRGSFEETCGGIVTCSKYGVVNTLTTISRLNRNTVFRTIECAYTLGATKAVLNCSIPVVTEHGIDASLALNPLQLAQVVTDVFQSSRLNGKSFQLNATFPLCLLDTEILEELLRLDWVSVGCHMYRGLGVAFDASGNVLPCTHFADLPLRTDAKSDNGNLAIDNFEEYWNDPGSSAGLFREQLWQYPVDKCSSCEYWGACIGGCPLLWTHFDPSDYIRKEETK